MRKTIKSVILAEGMLRKSPAKNPQIPGGGDSSLPLVAQSDKMRQGAGRGMRKMLRREWNPAVFGFSE